MLIFLWSMTTAHLFICYVTFMFMVFVPSYCCTYSRVLYEVERFIVYSFVFQFDVVDKQCCWVSLLTGMCTIYTSWWDSSFVI